jgi:dihydroorotase
MRASSGPEIVVTLLSDRLFDPRTSTFTPARITVQNGAISEVSTGQLTPTSSWAGKAIDLTGLLVTPGLIDFHTHIFHGQDLGVHTDTLIKQGVTSAVDAGSAGAHIFRAFKELVIDKSKLQIQSFLNIATVGTTSILLQGELKTASYCNEEIAIATALNFPEQIIGIKVRASHDVGGDLAADGFMKARSAATQLGLPLMVHLGPAPVDVEHILEKLNPGDFLTHAYTGWAGNTLVDGNKPRPSFVAAKKRGVLFDIGHGMGGFDSTVSQVLINNGFYPDTISTDIHAYSIEKVIGLPEVLSKFVALGMELSDVLIRATTAPAKFGRFRSPGVGTVDIAAQADISAFECIEGKFLFSDCHGHSFVGNMRMEPVFTMINGEVLFDRDNRAN